MKRTNKLTALFLSTALIGTALAGCLTGCTKKPDEEPGNGSGSGGDDEPTNTVITEKKTFDYLMDEMYADGALKDEYSEFSSVNDLKKAKVFVNGSYVSTFTSYKPTQDIKAELYSESKVRFCNISSGFAFSLPVTEISVDYSIADLQTQITFDDSILTATRNEQNPYTALPSDSWYPYGGEWLIAHLQSDQYMTNQKIERLNGTKAYDFTKEHARGDLEFRAGYDVYRYDFRITEEGDIERPYYNIAVVRTSDDSGNFEPNYSLFVMKSKSDKASIMDDIVKSYARFNAKGTKKRYFKAEQYNNPDSHWSAETKEYYNNLVENPKVDWGVFSYSMPGQEDSLHPGQSGYDSFLSNSLSMKEGIEEQWGRKFGIYPTYTHISWGGTNHYFPTDMANALAGGNGKNGKPVLQFTYQFTTNNNIVADELTPMWDVLRGVYDEHFRKLARDIKDYGKPVLFRLNNEMNTDWTSYSGMMTLLDPDVFNMTWIRLYNIFIEEGVNNCIWIWNPIATSCPYSSWSEDLCFFPGLKYVNFLGGTNYEMNNYAAGTATENIKSFNSCYSDLYMKNKKSFPNWRIILSEFACGSGGDYSGVLGRNRDEQAQWVKEMLAEFAKDTLEPWADTIKGAVWFNCNDYYEKQITNRLRIYDDKSHDYDDLSGTMTAFKEGFAKLAAMNR